MKIVFGALKEFNDTVMMNARQLGAEGIHFNTPPIAAEDEQFWTVPALQWLKEYAAPSSTRARSGDEHDPCLGRRHFRV